VTFHAPQLGLSRPTWQETIGDLLDSDEDDWVYSVTEKGKQFVAPDGPNDYCPMRCRL
jgi:hypothetical protein